MQDAYEAEDEVDDAADDAAEAQQKRSRAAALASGRPLPDTSAYFHERIYWGARWTEFPHSIPKSWRAQAMKNCQRSAASCAAP